MRLQKLPAIGAALVLCSAVAVGAAPGPADAPLPKGPAPSEIGRPLPEVRTPFAPPAGEVHTPPEYARNRGLILTWISGFSSELADIATEITTHDPDAIVTVVVENASQQNAATTAFTNRGAVMARVAFLTTATDSVWVRDYGPRFILEDRELAIVDHVYNRPRPNDDLVPSAFASSWGLTKYDIPLVHGGGNFHLFADGDAFMTELVLDENDGLSADDVEAYYLAYQNLNLTIWDGFPTSFDSTRHIDMWFLPVRDKVAIVGQYPEAAGTPYTITENAVSELTGRGYTILRTPGWNSGGTHYTYANAVIFNDVVLIPTYSGYSAQNSAAFATFLAAFPGRTIVPIDGDGLVFLAGVFHCIVMHVPDPDWLFDDGFETEDTSAWSAVGP